jgi:hypothetical protein
MLGQWLLVTGASMLGLASATGAILTAICTERVSFTDNV